MFNINSFLISSLFPRRLTEGIEKEAFSERSMLAIATLACNIAIRAAEYWRRGEIKKFDPNPGDGGCQIRGYLLYLFSYDRALREEMIGLGKQAKRIEQVVKERKRRVTSKRAPSRSSGAFFREQLGGLAVSRKLEFILQCYLLAVTRVPYQRLENGIVVTKSDANYLLKLSKNITKIVSIEECRKIVEVAQFNLSTNSVELLRMEAAKLTSAEKEQILSMLSPEMTRIYTPDRRYEPKTFGCLFYEYKAILFRLREERSLVCFKSIVPSDRIPFRILLRPREVGGEFSVIPKEDVDLQSPMVVFEGVVNARYGQERFSQKIAEIGFTELILATAAIESPYERGSELSAVTDEAAREEITRYRRFAEIIGCQKEAVDPLLILDHVYCNLLRAEMR